MVNSADSVENEVLCKKENLIATITFNRPQARNAITHVGHERFCQLLDEISVDPEVHVVILKGAGDKAFSAGHDFKKSSERPILNELSAMRARARISSDANLKIWDLPQPVISSVSGYCIGLGLSIAMSSDYIIAADNAQFGEIEISLGFAPDYAINPWKMSLNRAKELSMFGALVSAQDMYRYNVVNKVVPLADLEAETNALAKRLAELNYEAIKMVKYEYNKTYELMGFKNAINYCGDLYCIAKQSIYAELSEFHEKVREVGFSEAVKWREEKSGVKYRT